ncbi:MAG: HD domain-containing protein [Firmicutes bacterium]|nr:HD domain-containing protein [Bacillota bacterium]
MDLEQIKKRLKAKLSPDRFQHSLRVMELARKLATLYQIPVTPVAVAGLLHDVAREIPHPELLKLADRYRLPLSEVERRVPVMLHGRVGALQLKKEWGIEHAEILEAVALHVTGAPEMNKISQIIMIADFAEPGRGHFTSRIARELALVDRLTAVRYIFDQKIKYIIDSGFLLHPLTIEARNWFLLEET